MSRIIIHRRKSGKYDYTIVGDDVNENILVATVQGFERKAGAERSLLALQGALCPPFCMTAVPGWDIEFEYMTHAQYTEWRRKNRNQQRCNQRARKRS